MDAGLICQICIEFFNIFLCAMSGVTTDLVHHTVKNAEHGIPYIANFPMWWSMPWGKRTLSVCSKLCETNLALSFSRSSW